MHPLFKHPLFIIAVVAILASLGFSKLLAISLIFGFALFLCTFPSLGVIAYLIYHYAPLILTKEKEN